MLKVIANVIGYIATAQALTIFIAKKRGNILKLKLLNDVLWCLNFALQGTYTAALLNLIAIFRESVFYFKNSKKWAKSIAWLFIFVALMLISPMLVWIDPSRTPTDKIMQILPAIGSIIAVISFYMTKEQVIRFMSLLSQIPWIAFDIYNANIPALMGASITVVSVIIGMVLEYLSTKKQAKAAVTAENSAMAAIADASVEVVSNANADEIKSVDADNNN